MVLPAPCGSALSALTETLLTSGTVGTFFVPTASAVVAAAVTVAAVVAVTAVVTRRRRQLSETKRAA